MSDRTDIGSAPFVDPWVQPEFVTAIKVRRMAPGVWSYAQELQRRQDLKKRGIEQLDEPDGQSGQQQQQHLKPQPQQQQQQLLHHRSAESTSASAEYRKPSSDPQGQTSTVQAAALDPHLRLNDQQCLRPQVFQSSLQRSCILEAVRTPVPPDVKIPAPELSACATAVNAPSFADRLPASQPVSKCSRPSTASQMPIQSNSATLSPFMDNRLSTHSRQAGSRSALSAGNQDVYVRDTAYGFYRIQSDKWQQDGGRTQYTQLGVNAEVENLRWLEAMPSA